MEMFTVFIQQTVLINETLCLFNSLPPSQQISNYVWMDLLKLNQF